MRLATAILCVSTNGCHSRTDSVRRYWFSDVPFRSLTLRGCQVGPQTRTGQTTRPLDVCRYALAFAGSAHVLLIVTK